MKDWKTKPSRVERTCASSSSVSFETSMPSRRYCPDVGRSRHPRMLMSVDLPEPEGPMMARNSPRSTSRLTPRSAGVRPAADE